jgi:hypothetical protein
MALKKFSEVAKDGRCPKYSYAAMKSALTPSPATSQSAWPQGSPLAACSALRGRRSSAAATEPSICRADQQRSQVQPRPANCDPPR